MIGRRKYFDRDFTEVLFPLALVVHQFSRDLVEGIEPPKNKKVEEVPELCAAHLIFYSTTIVFHDLLTLASEVRNISSGILTRSILEGMANFCALYDARHDEEKLKSYGMFFVQQSDRVEDFWDNDTDLPVASRVFGSAGLRIERRLGGGWRMFYSHFCGYTHLDGGYVGHIFRDELKASRNFAVLVSSMAMLEIAKMALEVLPYGSAHEALKSRLDELESTLERGIKVMEQD